MLELDANIAHYQFEVDDLAPETFQVTSFAGTEIISRPYRFDLELVSKDTSVDFASVINRPATFTMMRGLEAVPVYGIIVDFEQAGRTAQHTVYRAVLVPKLWWLSLTYQTRILQRATV